MTTLVAPTPSPALVRFVTTGLLATIDSHRAGALPLHRFAWELQSRIDTLAELGPPTRVVTRLRWLHRAVEHLRATAAAAKLTGDEESSLSVTLTSLHTVLATLGPDSPIDPTGAACPRTPAQPATLRLVG